MKKILLLSVLLVPFLSKGQVSPIYYMSNYIRVVQPDADDSSDLANNQMDLVSFHNPHAIFDTLMNPFTGGFNNLTFFDIDFNGDGIQDLFVFDREVGENQFMLFQGLSDNSTLYRYAPQYNYFFPDSMKRFADLVDYNKDGLPDLFVGSANIFCNTCITAYKNTSHIDPITKKFVTSFKTVADSLTYYDEKGQQHEIDIATASDPQFVDVDGDGYIDILGFDLSLIAPQFFRNRGKLGGGDSLSFYYTKECWGYFNEVTQHLYQPWNCEAGGANYTGTWDSTFHSGAAHFNNSMSAFDVDGDGDIDLLLGDGLNDSLAFLENGRIDADAPNKKGYGKDTMVNITYSFNDNHFPIDYPAIIVNTPTPSFVDINHDTLNDLVVAAGEPATTVQDTALNTDRFHSIWYYENYGNRSVNGSRATNIFRITTKDFLQNTTVDWGVYSAPCFIDVDKDGRKDLIVAVRDGSKPKGNSHLILYLNKAGKMPSSKPYLLYKTNDYLGFSTLANDIVNPVPAAYLNTKDSSTDLLMGTAAGEVMYFKDGSTGKDPADFHLATSALQYLSNGKLKPIEVDRNSSPTAADLSGDGKTDLLIGCNDGTISYYRCLGFGAAPDYVPYFALVTSTFGYLDTAAFDDIDVSPCIADLDKDGKPDLLVGDKNGELWYYHDFDTTGTLVPTYQIRIHDYGTGKDTTQQFSIYSKPAVAYLDQDSFPDIMLGGIRGGLVFLGSANNPLENLRNMAGIEPAPQIYNPMGMSLFPNPAKDMVTIGYNNLSRTENTRMVVSDMLGKQILSYPFVLSSGKGNKQFSTAGLANGIYIVGVFSGDQLIYNNKLVIEK